MSDTPREVHNLLSVREGFQQHVALLADGSYELHNADETTTVSKRVADRTLAEMRALVRQYPDDYRLCTDRY